MDRQKIKHTLKALSLSRALFSKATGLGIPSTTLHSVLNPTAVNIDKQEENLGKVVAAMKKLAKDPIYRQQAENFIESLKEFLELGGKDV